MSERRWLHIVMAYPEETCCGCSTEQEVLAVFTSKEAAIRYSDEFDNEGRDSWVDEVEWIDE